MKSVAKEEFFKNPPLAFSLLLSIAIASTEVPFWISGFAFLMIAWKYLNEKFKIKKLSTKITPFLGALIFLIVYIQYKTILGQEESTTVLLGLVSLSILNYETQRDTLFLVLLGFLILVIKSVFSLDFIWTIPSLISFFGLWYSLLTNANLNKVRYLISTALKSLPTMILLFVLFPRLVIFQSKKETQRVIIQSGFNEDLNPGRFSEVALQNQMVFRADFGNNRMATDELYWRGAVLNNSNGFIWRKSISERQVPMMSEPDPRAISYRIILEPLNLKNVFVLDSPVRILSASLPIFQLPYRSFALAEMPSQQVQFEAQAAFNSKDVDIDDPVSDPKYLQFPKLPPKTKAFVDEVSAKNLTAKTRIEALRKFFSEKGFIYTLKPEAYQNNLDDFLFDRKKGFCEHFAASFGTLARALGIPSRIVLGYQGGLYNSIGNFWKVSQKDAHAWVEVGIDGVWTRVDPTAWVTPLRITLGGENYFSLSEDEQILYSKNRDWKKPESFRSALNDLKLAFDNLNYYWTVLLLNYDLQTQLEFLKKFQANSLVGVFFILLFVLLMVYNRKKILKRKQPRNKMSHLFSQVETWALDHGITIHEHQTPLQVLSLISEKFPILQPAVKQVAENYVEVLYEEKKGSLDTAELLRRWKKSSSQVSK